MDMTTALMIIAVLISPLLSTRVANQLEDRRQKYTDKMDLFKNLMANRKNDRESRIHLAKALNLIDVLFRDSKNIIHLYHDYRNALISRQSTAHLNALFCRLVQGIAADLGYCIDEKDIDLCVGSENLTYHDFQSLPPEPPE